MKKPRLKMIVELANGLILSNEDSNPGHGIRWLWNPDKNIAGVQEKPGRRS